MNYIAQVTLSTFRYFSLPHFTQVRLYVDFVKFYFNKHLYNNFPQGAGRPVGSVQGVVQGGMVSISPAYYVHISSVLHLRVWPIAAASRRSTQ